MADRASAYHATYIADSMERALKYEMESGMEVIHTESIKGKSCHESYVNAYKCTHFPLD